MEKPLHGKRVLVTGGSRGIGAAIVGRLAREGADVALTYVGNAKAAEAAATAARGQGVRAIAVQADSAQGDAIVAAVEKTVAEFGGIDILVNNAGVAAFGPVDQFSLEDFDRILAVNVRAVFVASKAAIPHMAAGSRIINIGSCNADRMPFPGGAAYAMSKSALVGLVKGMARDLGPREITVNNVQPGPVNTDLNPENGEFAEMLRTRFMAIPRYGKTEEIAALVAWLAGPESSFVTGASLTIDGGFEA